MANLCEFEMKVNGSTESIHRLMEIMTYKKDDDVFLSRIGSVEILEHDKEKQSAFILGYCAWSVFSCMFEGPHTYYTQFTKDRPKTTTIDRLCKELSLEVEIYAREAGVGFEEHYIISNQGLITLNKETSMTQYYMNDYETREDFEKETGKSIPQTIFDTYKEKDEWYQIGGFEWEFNI